MTLREGRYMLNYYVWLRHRKNALNKLARDLAKRKVDIKLIPLLQIINSSKHFYTLSSCYGRLVLLEIDHIGSKTAGKFYRSWHEPVQVEEIINEAEKYRGDRGLWLLLQSTIIHVSTYDLNLAIKFRNLALHSGYKYSKILSISSKGIVIEILGSERMDIPIKYKNKWIVNLENLNYINEYIKEMFLRIEERKNRLLRMLKKFKNILY